MIKNERETSRTYIIPPLIRILYVDILSPLYKIILEAKILLYIFGQLVFSFFFK